MSVILYYHSIAKTTMNDILSYNLEFWWFMLDIIVKNNQPQYLIFILLFTLCTENIIVFQSWINLFFYKFSYHLDWIRRNSMILIPWCFSIHRRNSMHLNIFRYLDVFRRGASNYVVVEVCRIQLRWLLNFRFFQELKRMGIFGT